MAFVSSPDSISKHKAMYKVSPISWKENYKRRCAERLKNSRSKLLDRYRKISIDSEDANVDNVMQEELMKIKTEFGVGECEDNVDFNDVIRCMEEIKAELLEWETETFWAYENQTANSDVTHETSMVGDDIVICPLCKVQTLQVCYGRVQCSCGLSIETEQDGIGIRHVKMSLEEGVSGHSAECSAPPEFSVVNHFGSTNLLITCTICDYMFIVV